MMLDLNSFPDVPSSGQVSRRGVNLITDTLNAETSSTLSKIDVDSHDAIKIQSVLRMNEIEDAGGGSLEPSVSDCDQAVSIVAQAISKPQVKQPSGKGIICLLGELSQDDSGTSMSSVVNAITTETASREFEASSQHIAENEDRLAEGDTTSNNVDGKYIGTALPLFEVLNGVQTAIGYRFGAENDDAKAIEDSFAQINGEGAAVSPRTPQAIVTRQFLPLKSGELLSANETPYNTFPRSQWVNLTFCQNDHATGGQKPLEFAHPVKKSRRGPRSRSSQYRGVTFYRRTGRWESHIW
eukprot:c18201_g1_i1 orf=199-1089(+)